MERLSPSKQGSNREDTVWKFLTVGAGVIVTVVAASAQAPSGKPLEFVALGCLESAQNGFILRDNRSGTRYRLDGSADMLGWHVGHDLEIHGTFQGPASETPTLKVDSVVYISRTCSQGSGKGN